MAKNLIGKKPTVVFDFDNTLFDAMQLKFLFRAIAQANGFSDEQSRAFYSAARNEQDGIIAITLARYVDEVRRRCQVEGRNIDEIATGAVVGEIQKKGAGLLLSGARELLEFCQQKKLNYYLLSLGVRDWQLEKMRWVKIDKIFSDKNTVFTVKENGGKAEALRALFGADFTGKNTVLFNDRADESAELLLAFNDLVVFLRRDTRDERSSGEKVMANLRADYEDRIVIADGLLELLKIFKKYVS
ncbi:MAG: hypothetical protein A3J93_02295 [Candidatus Magasanikbacteria bacterium RIFOXYC2_FULL_42_28]|uniref:Haloacid dehalogenase n=1 Tax=Candidatus Magasanikbacteria bacterium RIFOXYC2_FULL_42_28 TaxID=1798704 RepID=A0A1F6NW95_9BACT|nr:MAG: hypothetical protein A3J93_02295 [Candidatus Magasanikbacteria bacterium RIFOXYC2_FULL_42_28]